jgi:antirestriction protein ArdC
MTYKQAAQNEWQVRQGERGTHIEFWELRAREPEAAPDAESSEKPNSRRLLHRVYTVFNAQQIDGVPAYAPKEHTPFETVASGERVLANSGANILHDQRDRAFYDRREDAIHLPPKAAFHDAASYFGTALHELAHHSGHPSRLNRETLNESYRFGDTNYAREELRAELASVFLAAELGVPHDPAQHAAYVGSWIESLRKDKNEIFRAAHDASQAADFVLALDRGLCHSDALAVALGDRSQSVRGDIAGDDTRIQRENSRFVARNEPGTGAVEVHDKRTATDRHTPVEFDPAHREALAGSFAASRTMASETLGDGARTYAAQTHSGIYSGRVIGETEHHVVQRLSHRSAVAHLKALLHEVPAPGRQVAILYTNGAATIREMSERAKSPELAR